MTVQEAYDECKEWYQSDGMWELDGVAFVLALDALKKQIPEKPYRHPETQPKHFLKGVDGYYCPVCDRDVLDKDNDCFMYCPDCGQALDWSEEE